MTKYKPRHRKSWFRQIMTDFMGLMDSNIGAALNRYSGSTIYN